jgi:hypothetical protein
MIASRRLPRFLPLLALAALAPANGGPRASSSPTNAEPTLTASAMAHLPMRFEENRGQADASARFVARPHGASLVLTDDGATLALPHETALTLKVAGARRVKPVAEAPLVTRSNYLLGADRSKWHTDVANYGRVVYPSVLDGVDLVYHGDDGQLEYDFVVAPGASAAAIAVEVAGASDLSLTEAGDLTIHTARGDVLQRKPRVFQRDGAGAEHEVAAGYRLVGRTTIAFEVASYDRTRDLVIDPVVQYSTYLGGSGTDSAFSLAVDATGNAYITGSTGSTNFPTTTPAQAANAGNTDVFVAKLNNGGSALVYATYIGGAGDETANGIIVDATGSAHLVGVTDSADFPVHNAVHGTIAGATDAFVVKLAPNGASLTYATYLGGTDIDIGTGVAIDAAGNTYVSGSTQSTDFATASPLQAANAGGFDAFAAKLSADGSTVTYATYLGGAGQENGRAIAVDSLGNAYLAGDTNGGTFPTQGAFQATNATGRDGFVAKINADGSALVYSTYLGGNGADSVASIAVDATGNAYVAGLTTSTNFPTKTPFKAALAGATDAFVTKLDPTGAALVYSTYLGGSDVDSASHVTLDPAGSAYVVGATTSTDFPLMKAPQGVNGGGSDAFATKLTPTGSALLYSTYLGGTGTDGATGIVVDAKGDTFVSGMTDSPDFPKQAALNGTNAGGTDAFMTRLISTTALALAPATVKVAPLGSFKFTATGGTAVGYTFDIATNASGATMDPTTGTYTAGTIRGAVDVVRVKDSAGATATAMATVDPSGVGAPDGGVAPPPSGNGAAPTNSAVDTSDPDAGCSVARTGARTAPGSLLGALALGLALTLVARRRRG